MSLITISWTHFNEDFFIPLNRLFWSNPAYSFWAFSIAVFFFVHQQFLIILPTTRKIWNFIICFYGVKKLLWELTPKFDEDRFTKWVHGDVSHDFLLEKTVRWILSILLTTLDEVLSYHHNPTIMAILKTYWGYAALIVRA